MNNQLKVIDRFSGVNFFLSNFYPHKMIVDGIEYKTNEHYFQSMKGVTSADRKQVRDAKKPGDAKRLGRIIRCRSDWNDQSQTGLTIKEEVMLYGLFHKFQDPLLKRKLLETEDAILIEGNDWKDDYWGVYKGKGQNKLGILLMKLREELRNVK